MDLAVPSSALSPAATAWYDVIEWPSAAAQEPTPALTSPKYPLRSLACCDCEGLTDSATTNPPITRTAIAPNTHSGVRLVAQPELRSGTNGGSVCVGVVMTARWSSRSACGSRSSG